VPIGTVKSRLHQALATLRDDPACPPLLPELTADFSGIVRTRAGVAELHGVMTPSADDREPRLPDRLQRDLHRLLGTDVPIPERIDAALAAAARRQPARRRQRPWLLAGAATVAAAAGLLLLLCWDRQPNASAPSNLSLAREDFDGDGKLLVLDAYRLALALRRGEQVPVRFDCDGDGRVDTRDVELMAAAAVRLRG
jgi:hypothetical protein